MTFKLTFSIKRELTSTVCTIRHFICPAFITKYLRNFRYGHSIILHITDSSFFNLHHFFMSLCCKDCWITFCICNLKVINNFFLSLRTPVYFQIFLWSSNSRIKNIMRDHTINFLCNYYFNRIILQALRFMYRYSICNLDWYICLIWKICIIIIRIFFQLIKSNDRFSWCNRFQ